MRIQRTPIIWIFVFFVLMMLGAGLLVYFSTPSKEAGSEAVTGRLLPPEFSMSIVIVVAIVTMMALLFAIAAGFTAMRLTNPAHALGLPEGSIRAMIALILIMVFIIFGVYLFRSVGEGEWEGPMKLGSFAEVVQLGQMSDIRAVREVPDAGGTYYEVWTRTPIGADGARLAQQLITTVGTLVVAVAGFYFGSTTFRSGVDARGGHEDRLGPVIDDVTPKEGTQGDTVELKVTGRNLRRCQSVSLVRRDDRLLQEGDVVSSDTTATVSIRLSAPGGGEKWDVVVENENGAQDIRPRLFAISPPGTTTLPTSPSDPTG